MRNYQLWPGQFVNVRLKVETIEKAVVVPTSAVQRGPVGTFSYVIGENEIVTAKPVVVTQQNENDAVIASGLTPADRVVTTGFANLSDGAKVIGRQRRSGACGRSRAAQAGSRGPREGQGKDGQARDGQARDGQAKDGAREGRRRGRATPSPSRGTDARRGRCRRARPDLRRRRQVLRRPRPRHDATRALARARR